MIITGHISISYWVLCSFFLSSCIYDSLELKVLGQIQLTIKPSDDSSQSKLHFLNSIIGDMTLEFLLTWHQLNNIYRVCTYNIKIIIIIKKKGMKIYKIGHSQVVRKFYCVYFYVYIRYK